jgi:hypothetical protein
MDVGSIACEDQVYVEFEIEVSHNGGEHSSCMTQWRSEDRRMKYQVQISSWRPNFLTEVILRSSSEILG